MPSPLDHLSGESLWIVVFVGCPLGGGGLRTLPLTYTHKKRLRITRTPVEAVLGTNAMKYADSWLAHYERTQQGA